VDLKRIQYANKNISWFTYNVIDTKWSYIKDILMVYFKYEINYYNEFYELRKGNTK